VNVLVFLLNLREEFGDGAVAALGLGDDEASAAVLDRGGAASAADLRKSRREIFRAPMSLILPCREVRDKPHTGIMVA
jgi:hypothetical protein